MNWVSAVIVLVIAGLTYRAYRNGFVRELISLASVILAVPVAGLLYDDMVPKVDPIVDNTVLAALISFLALFAGVIIGGQVAAAMTRRSIDILNLGAADQLAGGAFGLLKGIIVCQAVLIALVIFPKPDLRDEIDASPVATTLLDGTPFVLSVLPARFDQAVDLFLDGIDKIEEEAARRFGGEP